MGILAECPICHKKQSAKNKLCGCGENLEKAKRSKRIRFWINFRVNGKQRREFVGYSIEEARDADGKRRSQKRENRIFDILPTGEITFSDLTKWFLEHEQARVEAKDICSDYLKNRKVNLESFCKVYGDKLARDITAEDLTDYKATRKRQDYASSYIDNELVAVKSMIGCAFDNRKVSGETLRIFKTCKKLCSAGENRRRKTLTINEYHSLYSNCPKHLKPIVAMGFWCGMRKSEITKLTWHKVDLAKRIISLEDADTKEKRAKQIPIPKTLRDIMLQLPNRRETSHVFTFRGKPIDDIRKGLKSACSASGIPYGRKTDKGFVFHDLRRTAKTIARKAKVSKNVRNSYFGHRNTSDMDWRYDQVDAKDLIAAIDQIEQHVDQNVDQNIEEKQDEAVTY